MESILSAVERILHTGVPRMRNCRPAGPQSRTLPRPQGGGLGVWALSYGRGTPARQSRPDSGLGFQAKVFKTVQAVPSSLGGGTKNRRVLLAQGYLAHKKQRPSRGPYSRTMPRALWWS